MSTVGEFGQGDIISVAFKAYVEAVNRNGTREDVRRAVAAHVSDQIVYEVEESWNIPGRVNRIDVSNSGTGDLLLRLVELEFGP